MGGDAESSGKNERMFQRKIMPTSSGKRTDESSETLGHFCKT
jgi:hypothetical protein